MTDIEQDINDISNNRITGIEQDVNDTSNNRVTAIEQDITDLSLALVLHQLNHIHQHFSRICDIL